MIKTKEETVGVKLNVKNYISEQFIKNDKIEINDETELLKLGIIDSLSMMTLIMFIEKNYGLDFYEIEINRDDFQNLLTIESLIVKNIK
ncbi:MAG: hypothetical protein GQ574_00085 [Crocinitomix sp.]|nr:hypothetical protein [Crocinitomix sp.]